MAKVSIEVNVQLFLLFVYLFFSWELLNVEKKSEFFKIFLLKLQYMIFFFVFRDNWGMFYLRGTINEENSQYFRSFTTYDINEMGLICRSFSFFFF